MGWIVKPKKQRKLRLSVHDWDTCEDYEWRIINIKDLDEAINQFNEEFKGKNVELFIDEIMELDYEE